MSSKVLKTGGWGLTILIALLFVYSAFMKFTLTGDTPVYGMTPDTYKFIGIIEVMCLILFIIPRTGVLGALLLVAYMGGAIVTHLQHHESIAMAVTVQILIWTTAFIRFPELKQRLLVAKN